MFTIDTGSEGTSGPFLAWSARGTNDGIIQARSFYVRDENGKTPFDASKGFILDIEEMKTGWQRSEGVKGVAPEWRWNASVSQMMPKPGEDYRKGFSIHCAIGGGKTAYWEQAGASVWNCLTELAPQLSQQPAKGQLPLVKLAGSRLESYNKGSTVIPTLEIIKWVDRPDCLKSGAAGNIALEPAPAPHPAPQPQVAVLDDAEF